MLSVQRDLSMRNQLVLNLISEVSQKNHFVAVIILKQILRTSMGVHFLVIMGNTAIKT